MQRKTALRRELKPFLTNLDQRWIDAGSRVLGQQLTTLLNDRIPYDIEHLLCFAAFFPGEVDLTQFISEQMMNRKIYLPISHDDGKMTFISIGRDWQKAASSGGFGIPEPDSDTGHPYNPEHAGSTAILLPGLAFDRSGNRIGRGKGYYDRFLSKTQHRDMLKIGIGWEFQLVEDCPSESHDITIDWYCYERGFVKTGASFEDID